MSDHVEELTHALLVQAIQFQAHARWWFGGASADLVDGIECMAKDAI